MTWALIDGCFVVADALSLAAVQPEGALAAESIRAEVKAAAREGAKSLGRDLAETGAGSTGKTIARQSAAGGASTASKRWVLVDRSIGRRHVPGLAAIARGVAAAHARSDDRGGAPPLHPGRNAPDHLAASPPAARWNRCLFRIPPERRVEVPDGPGPPGKRRRGRVPKNGRAPGLKKAASSQRIGTCIFEILHGSQWIITDSKRQCHPLPATNSCCVERTHLLWAKNRPRTVSRYLYSISA